MEQFKVIVKATSPETEQRFEVTVDSTTMQSALTHVKPIIVQEVKNLKECTKINVEINFIDY